MEADSQPLTRQFVSEVSIKMFEDELTHVKSQFSFVSQSKDTMTGSWECKAGARAVARTRASIQDQGQGQG